MYNPNQISLFEQPKQAVFKCRTVSLEGKTKPYTEWNDNDRMEWQANYTSSALLMPRSMILKMYNCSLLKQSREKNRNIGVLSQQLFVARISNLFNVSNQAAEIRLKNLGIIKQSNISTFDEEYDKQFYGI
jgi:Zn-dependent peptidase ImmA (M78 family)